MDANRKPKYVAIFIIFVGFRVAGDAVIAFFPGDGVRQFCDTTVAIIIPCGLVWWLGLLPLEKRSVERDGGMIQGIDRIFGPIGAAILLPGVPFLVYEALTQRQISSPLWGAYKQTAGILLVAFGLVYLLTIVWRALWPSRTPDAP